MKRRDFIGLAASAAATGIFGANYPAGRRAEAANDPIVGIVGKSSLGDDLRLPAIRQGLRDGGYVEGQNVVIDNRSAFGRAEQLAPIVADFVRNRVAVIITTGGDEPALAAKSATAEIPIVFTIGGDPVKLGFVDSLNHPGRNMTGFTLETTGLLPKSLELLHEMAPRATAVALILCRRIHLSDLSKQSTESAADAFGLKLFTFHVDSIREFEVACGAAVRQGAGEAVVAPDATFMRQRARIIALAARYQLPAIYPWREFVEDGGLMSYGPELAEAYREAGRYAARILDGAAPRDLPVRFPAAFELMINQETAAEFGLTISPYLKAMANNVIE